MIIRVFRPTIHPGKESEFESFLRDTAIPLMSQRSGLVAHVGRLPIGRPWRGKLVRTQRRTSYPQIGLWPVASALGGRKVS
jgi:hypothetical protein